jgi:cobalt/nickel transport system ATP-binding protein
MPTPEPANQHGVLVAIDLQDRAADRPLHHLSFGQRRRVAVATVLAMEPEILVLDEPSSNLDLASRRELADILTGLDITMLMVSHDLPYALELCPRAVVMNGGAVVADGPTARVLGDAELMAANRLELPYGFDPAFSREAEPGGANARNKVG